LLEEVHHHHYSEPYAKSLIKALEAADKGTNYAVRSRGHIFPLSVRRVSWLPLLTDDL
jgi:hypothetical protein